MKNRQLKVTYSEAFKQKVVNQIENGILTKSEARRLYNIGGSTTIHRWLRQLGKSHLINKVIHIQMKDEIDKLKELEKQKRELESALANAHLKIIALEETVKVLEESRGSELKKKSVTKLSGEVLKAKNSKKANTK